jgi:hypothetical protein
MAQQTTTTQMKKTPEEIANLWGNAFNMLPSDRIKLAKDIEAYHADKLAEVAGEELPDDKAIEHEGSCRIIHSTRYREEFIPSFEDGAKYMREITANILAKKQQQAKEEAVAIIEWIRGIGYIPNKASYSSQELYAKYKEENEKQLL